MKFKELLKIYRILGKIMGCQEILAQAKKDQDWDQVAFVNDYLTKICTRLKKLDPHNKD